MVIALVSLLAVAQPSAPPPERPACAGLIALPATEPPRPVAADDLLRLRDIGYSDDRTSGPSPLAVSPDGQRIAFVLRRADPETNSYCVALVTVAADGSGRPVVMDEGDDPIRYPDLNRGLDLGASGNIAVVTPSWSPDGRWIALRQNVAGVAQLWRIAADGQGAVVLTHLPEGVDDAAWTGEENLVFAHQPAKGMAEAAIGAEGRAGFLFDRRTWAIASARPAPPADLPTATDVIDPRTGTIHRATIEQAARLRSLPNDAPPDTVLEAASADGTRIARVAVVGPAYLAPTRLRVTLQGQEVACSAAGCGSGTSALWWDTSGALTWLRTERDAETGQMALYRWTPGQDAPRRLFVTDDLLTGCVRLSEAEAACLRESSDQPKRLVALDLRTGASRVLYDPNPSFASLRLGAARRLLWTDRYGVRTFGDLVLPPGHQPGQRHPLIVVQYDSRGFLRGGTGDEYPVQLFAARGFAVLSVNKSTYQSGLAPADDIIAYQHRAIPDSAYRRRTLALTEAGVAAAVATGTVDASKIGITGLSDGVLTACFAIMHTRLFAAAALSSGCEEPVTSFAEVGPAYRDDLVRWGYPYPDQDPHGFWNDNALSRNAAALRMPTLVQTSDHEFRLALETWATAREYGDPYELFVFPDEYHIKWQPAHRQAIYQRNLDWFDFWLRGVERPDAAAAAQYKRWRALRDATASSGPTPRRPPARAAAAASPGSAR